MGDKANGKGQRQTIVLSLVTESVTMYRTETHGVIRETRTRASPSFQSSLLLVLFNYNFFITPSVIHQSHHAIAYSRVSLRKGKDELQRQLTVTCRLQTLLLHTSATVKIVAVLPTPLYRRTENDNITHRKVQLQNNSFSPDVTECTQS